MRQRSSKIRKFYFKHEDEIHITILFLLGIIVFFIGYFISWKYIEKPMNDVQFKECEQVARSIYEQNSNIIVEVPEGFSANIDTTCIVVRLDSEIYRGRVIAKLQNGELIIIYDYEINEGIAVSILMGVLFLLLLLIVIIFYYLFLKKKISKT